MYVSKYPDIIRIAEYYGLRNQLDKLSEELRELDLATILAGIDLSFADRISDKGMFGLLDEMADVLIMINQIAYLLDIGDDVNKRIDFKIDRQLHRMDEEGSNDPRTGQN